MLTFHELIGFMSPGMANRILDDTQANNREVYRALVASIAQAQKMRPMNTGRIFCACAIEATSARYTSRLLACVSSRIRFAIPGDMNPINS